MFGVTREEKIRYKYKGWFCYVLRREEIEAVRLVKIMFVERKR